MARVTYGAMITELSGSIGGTSFQKNFSGDIARARPRPVRNNTFPQQEFQNNMSVLIALWPTLTQVQKNSWDAVADSYDLTSPWGITKTISGYQWFLSQNLNALSVGLTIALTGQTPIVIAKPDDFDLEADNTKFNILWDPAYNPDVSHTFLYASPPLRQASLKLRRALFLIENLHLVDETSVSIKTFYEDYFRLNWADFFDNSNCSIIIRLKNVFDDGYFTSTFTSNIIKIN